MADVKLHGVWSSPFSCRVIWALKLKGIPYEYIEEDLSNKSALLLQYNPVHKKVPVLVHGGKPICESMIIVEYIDETWSQNPLLSSDPYERALARFWIKFVEDKVSAIRNCFMTSGEEQEKAKKESLEMFKTLEEHGLRKDKKFFGGDQIGIMDIAFGSLVHWTGAIEDIIGFKFIDADKFPRLHVWIKKLLEVPVIKENLPDRDKLLALLEQHRERILASK